MWPTPDMRRNVSHAISEHSACWSACLLTLPEFVQSFSCCWFLAGSLHGLLFYLRNFGKLLPDYTKSAQTAGLFSLYVVSTCAQNEHITKRCPTSLHMFHLQKYCAQILVIYGFMKLGLYWNFGLRNSFIGVQYACYSYYTRISNLAPSKQHTEQKMGRFNFIICPYNE
jgi:hypothetical protein